MNAEFFVPLITTILCAIIGSSAGFGFIQFLITRKDKKLEQAKINHEEELKGEMKKHLTKVNDEWKEEYCDQHSKAIESLIQGLNDREDTGRKRYEEHQEAIKRMNEEHQQDFNELRKAIEALVANDAKITESIEKMAGKQDVMADCLLGQAHDRIIYLTDKISERGAITIKEKATLTSMYEPYKKLGGNGHCKTAMNHMDTLKVVSDNEAKTMDIRLKNKQKEIV